MGSFTKGVVFALLGIVLLACSSWAAGHDDNCVDCHSLHYATTEKMLMTNEPDASVNSHSDQPLQGVTAMCMGCHNGGGGPEIAVSHTHPVGISPIKVNVPAELLRDGKITCVGCHDPHPSNSNYKYLIVDTEDGASMYKFCGRCHGDKINTASAE